MNIDELLKWLEQEKNATHLEMSKLHDDPAKVPTGDKRDRWLSGVSRFETLNDVIVRIKLNTEDTVFKVNDRVAMKDPIVDDGVLGTVTVVSDYLKTITRIMVAWDDGTHNAYSHKSLRLISRPVVVE